MRLALAMVAVVGSAVAVGRWAARGRSRLGATARRGPRVGAVEVDMAHVRRVVDDALVKFKVCDPDELGQPRPGYVTPADLVHHAGAIAVHDAATGARRIVPTRFVARPGSGPAVTGGLNTQAAPASGHVYQEATVYPAQFTCQHLGTWRREMVATLAHELAHATDTGLRKRVLRAQPRARPDSYVAYLNDPEEITANLVAVRSEIEANPRAEYALVDMPPDFVLRNYSERWNRLDLFLTSANRQRFYRMAARLADETKAKFAANRGRAAATWRKRQLVEHVTRARRVRRKAA